MRVKEAGQSRGGVDPVVAQGSSVIAVEASMDSEIIQRARGLREKTIARRRDFHTEALVPAVALLAGVAAEILGKG